MRSLPNEFTLDDFKAQLASLVRPGIVRRLISLVPGMGELTTLMGVDPEAKEEVRRLIGIINSMTVEERRNPKSIGPSRCNRIAKGCGARTRDVIQLVRQFEFVAPMMKAMAGKGLAGRMRAIEDLRRGSDPGTASDTGD